MNRQAKPHAQSVRHVRHTKPAPKRAVRRSRKAKPVADIQDVLADNYVLLAAAVLGEAWRDATGRAGVSKRDQASARVFLHHSPLANSLAGVCDLDLDKVRQGRIPWSAAMHQQGFFIELPDSDDGHRHHTNARPVIIQGHIIPLRPGVGEVIVIEQPDELAVTIRAVPATNWVPVESRVAGAISEREYARLLAHVPGIHTSYVTAARRRAMGPSRLEQSAPGSRTDKRLQAAKSRRKMAATPSVADLGALGGLEPGGG